MLRKRILSICLILCMAVSTVPVFASESKADVEGFLDYLGVSLPKEEVDVEDRERTVTKSEFVYLVIEAMGQNAYVEKEYLTFSDVKLDDWYHDNVILAASLGVAEGHDNGVFGSADAMSEDTAALIMLRALGFGVLPQANADNLTVICPNEYRELVKKTNTDGRLTLKEAYDMLYNMLVSDYVVLDMEKIPPSYKIESEKIYMESAFKINKGSGRVTGNEYTGFGIAGSQLNLNSIEIDGVRYETDIEDTRPFLGYYVDYYLGESDSKDEVIKFVIPRDSNEVTKISSEDIEDVEISGKDIVVEYVNENNNTKELYIPITCDFVYNGKTADFSLSLLRKLFEEQFGEITIVEYNDFCMLSVIAYDTMVVDTVSLYDEMIYGRNNADPVSIKAYDANEFFQVEKDGEEISVNDIKKGDVLEIAQSLDGNSKKITVSNNVLSGTVTGIIGNDKVEIDNVVYELSNYFIKNRAKSANMKLGLSQQFLFNSNGELVDIAHNSAEYKGEYVFLTDAIDCSSDGDERGLIKYVTMDGNVTSCYLAQKVNLNGGGMVYFSKVIAKPLLPYKEGIKQRQVIYIEKNEEGLINVINTADMTTIDGTVNKNDVITMDAVEKERKCKSSSLFLQDTNDMNFPEFYMNSETKILMVPQSTADDEAFKEANNYAKRTLSDFKDAENYIVEAYNFNDYNVAEILLLRQAQTWNSRLSNNNIMIVTGIGQIINADNEVVPNVMGYQDGEYVEVKLNSDDVAYYTKDNKRVKIKKNDIVRFNLNNAGEAIHMEYFKNIDDDFEITDYPEGRNDGNAIVIGRVVSYEDNYLRLEFTDNASVKERVFRGNLSPVTIVTETGKYSAGTQADLTPGTLVLLRVFYSTVHDVIAVKE